MKLTLYLAGLSSIVAGCALIYRPLGLLVGGIFAVGIAFAIDKYGHR